MKGIVLEGRLLLMTRLDTVATAIEDLDAGESIEREEGTTITINEPVNFGHKVALEGIEVGDPIRKYGEVIGRAVEVIDPGDWVHTHNVESTRGRGDRAQGDAE